MRNQPIIRWLSILYLWELMILAGITFFYSKDMVIFTTFASRTGITLSYIGFSILSFTGAILIPFICLLSKSPAWLKRTYYVACGLPLGAFTAPYAVWLAASHTYGIGLAVYLNIFVSFIIIAWTTFRSDKLK